MPLAANGGTELVLEPVVPMIWVLVLERSFLSEIGKPSLLLISLLRPQISICRSHLSALLLPFKISQRHKGQFSCLGTKQLLLHLLKSLLKAIVVGSDVPQHGRASVGNDVVSDILEMTKWSQLSNLMSIPTDCPQRDERLGWLGTVVAHPSSLVR